MSRTIFSSGPRVLLYLKCLPWRNSAKSVYSIVFPPIILYHNWAILSSTSFTPGPLILGKYTGIADACTFHEKIGI